MRADPAHCQSSRGLSHSCLAAQRLARAAEYRRLQFEALAQYRLGA
eukprot:CAMPEP_0176059596 /NCGR_PEP_ID=MMETSP0120_2-20121206/29701_1 /TAXON_ID=160619 /ORGANISM="Kryptoperidinium foliaceum, Strain CCMP 1326" /LENGTH=45 /DNA_ID= /DNA_START= /DNA_END= /DNA_ORIENTATION=